MAAAAAAAIAAQNGGEDNSTARERAEGFMKKVLAPKLDNTPVSRKERLWAFLEDPGYSEAAKNWCIFILVCTLASTLCFVLESELAWGGWDFVDTIFVQIFTLEFTLRLFTCPRYNAFCRSLLNWIDVAAILPFWIAFCAPPGSFDVNLGAVKVVRLLRAFRVLKFGRYSRGMQVWHQCTRLL